MDEWEHLAAFEEDRLHELYSLSILDTYADEAFDRITRLAGKYFGVPIVLISLVDAHRQWFKSKIGLEAEETSREVSFCAHAIYEPEVLVIPDAREDPRFAANPFVVGEPFIRFYAGAVFRGSSGHPLGTLCIIDHEPRDFSEDQAQALIEFAKIVEEEVIRSADYKVFKSELIKKSFYDEQTGLPNRAFFITILEQNIELEKSGNKSGFFVISVVFRNMKAVKSLLEPGELAELTGKLNDLLRKPVYSRGVLGRWQEDVFVILGSFGKNQKVQQFALAVREVLDPPLTIRGKKIHLDARLGISLFPDHGDSAEALVENSLKAVPAAPPQDVPFQVFRPEQDKALSRRYQLESRLRAAIEAQELDVLYQPKVELASGLPVGAEALVRWSDPELGTISPGEFIPVAEESGLIFPLGDFVARTACRQTLKILQSGLSVTVAVNLSSSQLLRKNFFEWLQELLEETGLPGKNLNFEVTESTLIEDMNRAIINMTRANSLDVTFSIDDFGTGYSSLGNLQKLPLHTLKIDKSFIDNIVANPGDAAIAQATIAMAHSLGLKVVAEGVETREQLLFLKAYQCDKIQGYLFSKPLTLEKYVELLEKALPDRRFSLT